MDSDDADSEVIVLGAGFSHAVSDAMPVANRLGELASAKLASNDPKLPVFSDAYPFEAWLSLLAEDQPYLHEAENRDNQARFARLRDAIAEALDEAEKTAFSQPARPWFRELLSVLHYRRSTVISFNYDTMIEAGLASQYLDSAGSGSGHLIGVNTDPSGVPMIVSSSRMVDPNRVTPADVLRAMPATQRPLDWSMIRPQVNSLRLLKLHGSLDWWSVPDDPTGATLTRHETGSTFEAPVSISEEERGALLPGRERFIVPPLATKSPYYRNPITRQLWQDAFKALKSASRISLIGYSSRKPIS